MGKRSRTKGHDWEREVANRLTQATGVECKRCLVETREGNSGDIQTQLPLAVQCKVGQRPNPIAAYEEALEAAEIAEEAVAVIKRNQGPGGKKREVAVISFEYFLRLLEMEHGKHQADDPEGAGPA